MSAASKHLDGIIAVREAIQHEGRTVDEIHEITGLHRIFIKERLEETRAWGFGAVLKNGKWGFIR